MAHQGDIGRFLLRPDKYCIIAEHDICYYMNNYILSLPPNFYKAGIGDYTADSVAYIVSKICDSL